jgi:large subunit ribosomal protein L30
VAKKQEKKLLITQVRSGIGRQGRHRRTLLALGIKRHQSSVIHDDTPAIRGMINQIGYLLDVQEVD